MLTHPTLDKLQTLKLSGMYHALVEQLQMSDIAALSFEERFGLLVDRELTERDNRRLTTRLRQAPVVALDRLHTDYQIAVTSKQRPPWVPIQVFDDGTRTYIRYAEDLSYTRSPAVFGVHSDHSPAIVEFTTYTAPQGSVTYIVNGLYPQLVLRGTDNMEVTITRGPNARNN